MTDDLVAASSDLPPAAAGASISRASALRLAADGAVTGFGVLTGIVTARNLGPPGKGALSTLSYLVALAWLFVAMGSGEAGVSLVGSRQADLRRALGTTISLLVLASLVVVPALYGVSRLPVLGVSSMHGGRLAALVAVPATAFAGVLPLFAEHRGLFGWTSAARIIGATVTFAATVYLVAGRSLSVFGGMLAVAMGPVALTLVVAIGLHRDGIRLVPAWDLGYLRRAVRLGLPVQVGYLVAVGAARADVLVVAALRSDSDVGIYSVALTVGQVAMLPAVAISAATFPRIARATKAEAAHLTRTTLRLGLLASVAGAAALAAVATWLVPAVFGPSFDASVGATQLLLLANVASAAQWITTRSCAARGETGAIARSYAVSLAVMLAVDVGAVRWWGAIGGAVGSLVAGVAGAAVALLLARRAGLLGQASTDGG